MSNNYFLTGEIRVGKSTLIHNIMQWFPGKIYGFQTFRVYTGNKIKSFCIQSVDYDISAPKRRYFIARRCVEENRWEPAPSVFDKQGVHILKDAIRQNPDMIIMDELGFFENEATLFQKQVMTVLDSEIPVLGVIKQIDTPFLDMIRKRKDVTILTITKENRDDMYQTLIEKMNIHELI